MANVDPQILNILRAQHDVGSQHIEHAHSETPTVETEADTPPEGLVDRMIVTARAAAFLRETRLRLRQTEHSEGDELSS